MGQNISLGTNCSIRIQFDNHNFNNKNKPTLLFDWLITGKYPPDEKQKILVEYTKKLSMQNINNILLRKNNFDVSEFKISGKNILLHKDFIAIHDLNTDNSNLKECVDKYNRRLQRLKEIIINEKEKLIFYRLEYENYNIEDYKKFIQIVKNFNPKVKILVKIISTKNIFIPNNIKEIKIILAKDYEIKNKDPLFSNNHLKWNEIFNIN